MLNEDIPTKLKIKFITLIANIGIVVAPFLKNLFDTHFHIEGIVCVIANCHCLSRCIQLIFNIDLLNLQLEKLHENLRRLQNEQNFVFSCFKYNNKKKVVNQKYYMIKLEIEHLKQVYGKLYDLSLLINQCFGMVNFMYCYICSI